MATAKNAKPAPRQGSDNRGGGDSFYLPPPDVLRNQPDEDSKMGFLISLIAMVAVFGVLLPLMAMLYFDILEVREQTKQQQQTVQKLIDKAKEK
jgi:hypothetical protein